MADGNCLPPRANSSHLQIPARVTPCGQSPPSHRDKCHRCWLHPAAKTLVIFAADPRRLGSAAMAAACLNGPRNQRNDRNWAQRNLLIRALRLGGGREWDGSKMGYSYCKRERERERNFARLPGGFQAGAPRAEGDEARGSERR